MIDLVCNSSIKSIIQKIPWGVWIILPIFLQATVLRKRGSFNYRRVVSLLCVLVTTVYGSIAFIVYPGKAHRISYKFHQAVVRLFLALDATLEDEHNLLNYKHPAVFVTNHQTILDLHYMAFGFPNYSSIVAKESLKKYPFMGWFLTLTGAIFVDRQNRGGDAVKQARQVAESMKRLNKSIYVYPEGTRRGVETIGLSEFKKGPFYMATQAKVPIIPIVTANYKHIYDPERKFYGHGNIRIKVLPPISTESISESSEAVAQLTVDVREKMLAALKEISVVEETKKIE